MARDTQIEKLTFHRDPIMPHEFAATGTDVPTTNDHSPKQPPLIAQTKPFAGVTLHGASFQHRFFTLLQKYIPDFEDKTGMKVDLQLSALPVYNQQANLELSSGGSAYDFVNVTFTLATRWIAAGLLANLDEFTGDANLTPAEWNPKDFVDVRFLEELDRSGFIDRLYR